MNLPKLLLNTSLLCVSLLACTFLNAQLQWSDLHTVSEHTGGSDLAFADIDNDGLLDLVTCNSENDNLAWQRNEGDNNFSGPILITEVDTYRIQSLSTGDMDGDGKTDIVVIEDWPYDNVKWLQNLENGVFEEHLIDGSLDDPFSLHTADLDQDGDLDILATSHDEFTLVWYENYGNGEFSNEIILNENTLTVYGIETADLDNDGDIDIISASATNDAVKWFENLGNGNFSDAIVISDDIENPADIHAGDFNNDGDMDISCVFGVNTFSTQTIVIFENDGSGNFVGQDMMIENMRDTRKIASMDVDEDGDLDLVATGEETFLGWYENDGEGVFISFNEIDAKMTGYWGFRTADTDNDGDDEVFIYSKQGQHTYFYENLSNASFEERKTISSAVYTAYATAAADLSGDGLQDIIATSYGERDVVWFEQLPDGSFSREIVLSTDQVTPKSVVGTDIDDDGDVDVLFSSSTNQTVVFLENLGGGGFADEQIIAENYHGAKSIKLGDMDNDGDDDIVFCSNIVGRLAWIQNLGSGNFSQAVTLSNVSSIEEVAIADFNGDELLDVVYAAGDRVRWVQNIGNGSFSGTQVISDEFPDAAGVDVGDMNSDGLPDVVAISDYGDRLSWFVNQGDGSFSTELIIDSTNPTINFPFTLHVADLNGDGDLDISVGNANDRINWYENNGNGLFFYPEQIAGFTDGSDPKMVRSADIDNDGDLDIVSTFFNSDKVGWFENLGTQGCTDQTACNYQDDATDDDGSCCYSYCGCTDPGALNYLAAATCDNGSCSYRIEGYVFHDENEDGIWDDNENPVSNQEVFVHSLGWTLWTNEDGKFNFTIDPGTYVVEVINSDALPYSTTEDPLTIETTDIPENIFFGVSNDVPYYDLFVTCHPGLPNGYPCDDWVDHQVFFVNNGNVPLDGIMEIQIDSLFQEYVNAAEIDSINGNTLYLSFENIEPGSSYSFNLELLTPTVDFIGEFITTAINVYAYYEGEEVASGENVLVMEMTCAYDPNDKQVFPGGYAEPHFILNETELEYLIRFQNTGNAPATDVLVTDTIDPHLDLSSFALVTHSHSVQVILKPEERVFEFLFENIMLPDSNVNEPESHGFISFKIDPYPDLDPGTELNNTGYIYFDNNPPIITNTTWNTIYECTDELATVGGVPESICASEEIYLESNETYIESYSWMLGEEELSNESVLQTNLGTADEVLMLTVENPICIATNTFDIDILTGPELTTEEELTVCMGESVVLTASGGESVQWIGFAEGPSVTVSPMDDTIYEVTSTNDIGCETTVEVTVSVDETPDTPVISISGNDLLSDPAESYQWYLNGEAIDGATDQAYIIEEDGNYAVEVTNAFGCSTFSEENFLLVNLEELSRWNDLKIYPNPASDIVVIETGVSQGVIEIHDASGRMVLSEVLNQSKMQLAVSGLSDGVYQVSVVSEMDIFTARFIVSE